MKTTLFSICSLVAVFCHAGDGSITTAFDEARQSARIAGLTLSKTQRWLHEVALNKIDPRSKLYISHGRGSGRYPEALWNYDDTAADTYPFLFWAAWYTDRDLINGPVLDVLKAEQRLCNHLDRIPTALDHRTLQKVVKSKDDTIFAASEYVKDGLIAIIEVAGVDNPWFKRMRAIEDDIWKHADIETPYGNIPTRNLEANGEQLQALTRLFAVTGEAKYLEWAERLGDYYLLDESFMPQSLRDHGCEVIGGLGLLLCLESEQNPEKLAQYLPPMKRILDTILERGVNEDGLMYNRLGKPGALSDSWGYNYVTFLCYDMVVGKPVYRDRIRHVLQNLNKAPYIDYPWERKAVDGFADSVEGALYLLNRLHEADAVKWVNGEIARNIVFADRPARLWTTYKLESNGVRTALQHAMMHTKGLVARPWAQGMELGGFETADGLAVVIKAKDEWTGKLQFDSPRHRTQMGFSQDWPRMNAMPEWFTVERGHRYLVQNLSDGTEQSYSGDQLQDGLPLVLWPSEEVRLLIKESK